MPMAPAVLALFVAAQTETQSEAQLQHIAWSWEGLAQTLAVRSSVDGELALVDRPDELLRSVVGPMVSTLKRKHWLAESGGYVDLAIVTERRGAYHFDLLAWVDASRQSGAFMRQLLTVERCGLDSDCHPAPAWPTAARCPTAQGVAAWDGAFADLASALLRSSCFTAEALALEAGSFWIDDAQGELVRLAVQREHCDGDRSSCIGSLVYVDLRAPEAWHDWLADAKAGKGFLPRTRAFTGTLPSGAAD